MLLDLTEHEAPSYVCLWAVGREAILVSSTRGSSSREAHGGHSKPPLPGLLHGDHGAGVVVQVRRYLRALARWSSSSGLCSRAAAGRIPKVAPCSEFQADEEGKKHGLPKIEGMVQAGELLGL